MSSATISTCTGKTSARLGAREAVPELAEDDNDVALVVLDVGERTHRERGHDVPGAEGEPKVGEVQRTGIDRPAEHDGETVDAERSVPKPGVRALRDVGRGDLHLGGGRRIDPRVRGVTVELGRPRAAGHADVLLGEGRKGDAHDVGEAKPRGQDLGGVGPVVGTDQGAVEERRKGPHRPRHRDRRVGSSGIDSGVGVRAAVGGHTGIDASRVGRRGADVGGWASVGARGVIVAAASRGQTETEQGSH